MGERITDGTEEAVPNFRPLSAYLPIGHRVFARPRRWSGLQCQVWSRSVRVS